MDTANIVDAFSRRSGFVSRMTIRPYLFWPLSVIAIPAVYCSAACFYTLHKDRYPGPSPNWLLAVLVISLGIGVAALQFLVAAETGIFRRVVFALLYVGGIFVLTMIVTFLVLLFVFGPDSTTY